MAHGNAKYTEWITEEGLVKIEGWARDGLIDREIAEKIGVSEQTLNNWKKKFPKIFESLKRGKDVVDRQVENALLRNALGYEYEEVDTQITVDADGNEVKKVHKVKRPKHPDTTAQIFWLKNRKPADWRDKHEVADTTAINKLDEILEGVKDSARD